jgi:hypothetical protein
VYALAVPAPLRMPRMLGGWRDARIDSYGAFRRFRGFSDEGSFETESFRM